MTQIKLVANAKNNVDLHIIPIKDEVEITEEYILDFISESEHCNLLVNKTNINNALAELNDVLKSLKENQTGHEIIYHILDRVDASISIIIDDDEMSAKAIINTAHGGKHLSAKAILNAAQAAGVKKGFSKEELVKLAHLAAKEEPNSKVTLPIAHGKLPINGRDAIIEPLVESAQSRILRPKNREDGSVDMRDLGDIICVKIGDPIVKKIPLTQGRQGYTVTGKPLETAPGNDVVLISGDGTAISKSNENLLIAEKVGLPKLIPNGMEVDEVYQIKNVTVATGHINFTGSVLMEGDVNEGMKVIASGDITIGGFVESAMIEAGGDVTISGGIIGRKHDIEETKIIDVNMSVSVNARGNLYAKYCQYAQINCGKDIRIENQLLHSIINVNGSLKVGTEDKSNGILIGGSIKARSHVSAGIVGATAGSKTMVSFEHHILKLKELLDDIETRINFDNDKTAELKVASDKIKELPKTKANHEMLTKVISTYQFHAKRMGDTLLEKEEQERALQAYIESVYLEATEKLHLGVQLTIGDYNDRSRRDYGPSRMIYKDRKIHIEPLLKR